MSTLFTGQSLDEALGASEYTFASTGDYVSDHSHIQAANAQNGLNNVTQDGGASSFSQTWNQTSAGGYQDWQANGYQEPSTTPEPTAPEPAEPVAPKVEVDGMSL